jgi:hypothetical protein
MDAMLRAGMGKMLRLDFLDDGPWDQVDEGGRRRVRGFGHAFGADMLGASPD